MVFNNNSQEGGKGPKHKEKIGLNESKERYEPWRRIGRGGVREGLSPP